MKQEREVTKNNQDELMNQNNIRFAIRIKDVERIKQRLTMLSEMQDQEEIYSNQNFSIDSSISSKGSSTLNTSLLQQINEDLEEVETTQNRNSKSIYEMPKLQYKGRQNKKQQLEQRCNACNQTFSATFLMLCFNC